MDNLRIPLIEEANVNKDRWYKSISLDFVKIPKFKNILEFVKLVGSGGINGLIIHGRGGIGKTRLVLSQLKKQGVDFAYNNSYTTPLAFAQFLYENKHNKVIVLDDVEGILSNRIILNMLKACLDTKPIRLVYYNSTSTLSRNTLPTPFAFDSRIIILINYIPRNTEIESLFSRMIVKEVDLRYDEIISLAGDIIKTNYDFDEKEIKTIVSFLEKNTSEKTKDFNFRTIDKVVKLYKYNREKWVELAKDIIEEDEDFVMIRELERLYPKNRARQIQEYSNLTHKGRRTFYRKLSLLTKNSVKVSSNKDVSHDTKRKR